MLINTCSNYDPKRDKDYNNNKVANGWEMTEIPWQKAEIIKLTTEYGISCNEYSDGHKCNNSWVAAHAIMLDFDGGFMTAGSLIEVQQNDWQFNSYIYSSQNHLKPKMKSQTNIEPACERLRALIPLKEPITDTFILKAVEEAYDRAV